MAIPSTIYPGQYNDCAYIRQNNVTFEGKGPGVVLTDKTCAGKAILITGGNNITIRNITLQRARVADRNGAGIRAEGGEPDDREHPVPQQRERHPVHSPSTAQIRILGSEFIGNGKCEPSCAHGIYINGARAAARRAFEVSRHPCRPSHQVPRVPDGGDQLRPGGRSRRHLELPDRDTNGGTAIVEGNTMEKGPKSENQANAIMIGAEGVKQPTETLLFRNNTFTNDQNRPTTFVNNRTATPAQLIGNVFKGQVTPLEGPGTVK